VISDQSATLQTLQVTGDARRGHTSGVDHPRARAYVHLGGPLPFMAAAATEQLHWHHSWWERPHNLFPSRKIYFPGINNPSFE